MKTEDIMEQAKEATQDAAARIGKAMGQQKKGQFDLSVECMKETRKRLKMVMAHLDAAIEDVKTLQVDTVGDERQGDFTKPGKAKPEKDEA